MIRVIVTLTLALHSVNGFVGPSLGSGDIREADFRFMILLLCLCGNELTIHK